MPPWYGAHPAGPTVDRVRVTVVSGLAVAAVLALVAPAAPPAAAAPAGAGDTLTVGVLDLPLGLNPNTAADAGQPALDATAAVLPSVFPAGRLRPRLNRSLFAGAAVTSTAPFTVTYLVRPQAVWSDGVPLGYSDFALAWRAQSGRTGGVTHAVSTDGYRDIRTVTGAATAAGRRITVVFAKPYIEWRSLFSSMLPAHVVTLGEWDNAVSVNLPPLSAGPYAVAATQTPGTLTLVRNLRYPGRRAAIARIVFRQYPSRSALVGALRRGAVQLVVPATNPEDELPLRGLPGVRAVPVRSVFYEHLDFNLHDPVAGDPAVRHAVARAVDDEAVARAASAAYGGAPAQVTGGRLLQPGQPGYADQRGPDGHGDTVGARALLTAAGWAPGADGVFARAGLRAAFTLVTTAGNRLRTAEAEALRAQLAPAGIEVTLRYEPADRLFAALPRHRFQATLFGWVGSPATVSALGPVVRTRGSGNYGGLADPRVDVELERAARALSDGGEQAALRATERLLWLDAATVPLVERPVLVAASRRLHGVTASPTLDGIFATAGRWRLDPS